MPTKGLMPPSVVMREVGRATPLPSAVGIPMVLPRRTGAWARCDRPPVRHRPLNTRQNSSEPSLSSNPGDLRNPESLLLPRGTHEGRHPQGYVPEGL